MRAWTSAILGSFPASPRQEEDLKVENDSGESRSAIASRAHNKWRRRIIANQEQDWLDAESEIRELHLLVDRVKELEEAVSTQRFLNLSGQLAQAESRLANLAAEAKQTAHRLAGVHEVSRLLTKFVQFSDTILPILQVICECYSWDVGVFWMLDQKASSLRRIELWHAPTVEASALQQISRDRKLPLQDGLPCHVWASSSPVWTTDVRQGVDFAGSAIAAEVGLHGSAAFPVHNNGDFVGIMGFYSREILEPDEELVEMMDRIGTNISQSIEIRGLQSDLRQQYHERHLARVIQQRTLPKGPLERDGLRICGRSSPSNDIGGDYYDHFPMVDGSLGVVIGDASGHGIGAALLIAETSAYVRALVLTSNDPAEILSLTGRRLIQDLSSDYFVTLLLVRFDLRARSLRFAGAGHCPGYVLDRVGQVKAMLRSQSQPLGMDDPYRITTATEISLETGDLVFLYTDGLVEAGVNGDQGSFGIDRALGIVQDNCRDPLEDILGRLFDAVNKFASPQSQFDDVTAVLLRLGTTTHA